MYIYKFLISEDNKCYRAGLPYLSFSDRLRLWTTSYGLQICQRDTTMNVYMYLRLDYSLLRTSMMTDAMSLGAFYLLHLLAWRHEP